MYEGICAGCSVQFTSRHKNQKYCNLACYDLNRKRVVFVNCIMCGVEFRRLHKTRKYCSLACKIRFEYEQYIERWKRGEETGNKSHGNVSNYVKRYLKAKCNNSCSQCGWAEVNPVTGLVPVQVDHIDGDWRNSSEENLRLLCPNCHSLTETFGALNIKKGNRNREPTRERLRKEGKVRESMRV